MRTTARNVFKGVISKVNVGPILAQVTLNAAEHTISAIITTASAQALNITQGSLAKAMVKATSVLLAKEMDFSVMSVRNAYRGVITSIRGDGVMVEVVGKLKDETMLCALITQEALNKLGLSVGEEVFFFFKATSVMLSMSQDT